jgi:hypothetical protein
MSYFPAPKTAIGWAFVCITILAMFAILGVLFASRPDLFLVLIDWLQTTP